MVASTKLLQTISFVTGVPLPTVVDIDRKLVNAGLRTKLGRGRNGAQMRPIDAARILTAILAGPQANQSATAVTRYAQTRIDRARSSEGLYGVTGLDDLAALPTRHGFVDALATLIGSAGTGSLSKLLASATTQPNVEVFAFTRATYGRLRISGLPNGLTTNIEYVATRSRDVRSTEVTPTSIKMTVGVGDLEQSRRVTERTIFAVANLLAGEQNYDDS